MDNTSGSLIIATLSISYGRGKACNNANDLGLTSIPQTTPDGKPICGGGTHYTSAEAVEIVKERNNDAARIRAAFSRSFVAAPFDGAYILPKKGAGQDFLAALDPRPRLDLDVCVSEYVLSVESQAPQEVSNWAERIQSQLDPKKIPMGRGKAASEDGLQILTSLAACPIISSETRAELLALIRDARLAKVDRVDFRRRLADVKVSIAGAKVDPARPIRPAPSPEPTEPTAPAMPPRAPLMAQPTLF